MNDKRNVIIIGGGAIGMCIAYYLLESGVKSTVIGKGELGHEVRLLYRSGEVKRRSRVEIMLLGSIS